MNDHLKKWVQTYIGTALWSSSDNLPGYDEERDGYQHPENLDDYAAAWEGDQPVLSFGVLRGAVRDCKAFMQRLRDKLPEIDADFILSRTGRDLDYLAPHDFWLTRNHHGAGFWDGDWDGENGTEYGETLTTISHEFKEIDLYIGDNGRIYQ